MFESTLKQLVDKVDGAQGAAVLNLDGLIIEAVDGAGEAVTTAEALSEYGLIVRQLLDIGDAADLGKVGQLTIEGQDRTTLIRQLDDQYIAALQVGSGSIVGKAHFYLRIAAPDLAREL